MRRALDVGGRRQQHPEKQQEKQQEQDQNQNQDQDQDQDQSQNQGQEQEQKQKPEPEPEQEHGGFEDLMSSALEKDLAGWMDGFVGELKPVERRYAATYWRVQTSGAADAAAALEAAERELRRLFQDPERFRWLRGIEASGEVRDPLLARQVALLRRDFEGNQMSDADIARLVGLQIGVENEFNNFRADLRGEPVTDNRLCEVLRQTTSSDDARAAWEASKQIGLRVAPRILDLVELRNRVARDLGHANHQEMSLDLAELEPRALFDLLDEIETATDAPYDEVKAAIDGELAARFRIDTGDLRPWHYGNPFFQTSPASGGVDLDRFYAGKDIVDLSTRFYDGIGLDIRGILSRSDLFERPGKCQHAFCMDLDRDGDVRVLCNIEPNERWMGTMLHELGHAVYEESFAPGQPHLLRGAAHLLTTEAIAMLFGRLSQSDGFLERVAGVDAAAARASAAHAREELRRNQLIFMRWGLVMTHFERALYRDPSQDLDSLWWDLVERFQRVRRPEGRRAPDWATKIHIATAPIYYQNYILGELTASQLQARLLDEIGAERTSGVSALIGQRRVGELLVESIFRPGRRLPWHALIEEATGEALSPRHFLADFVGGSDGVR